MFIGEAPARAEREHGRMSSLCRRDVQLVLPPLRAGMSFCLPLAFYQERQLRRERREVETPLLASAEVRPSSSARKD